MNIFKQNNNNNYGILNRGVNSKYILEYNLSNTYNNYTKTELNTLDSHGENSRTYKCELKDEKIDKSIKKDKNINKGLAKNNNELNDYMKTKIKKMKINAIIKNKIENIQKNISDSMDPILKRQEKIAKYIIEINNNLYMKNVTKNKNPSKTLKTKLKIIKN